MAGGLTLGKRIGLLVVLGLSLLFFLFGFLSLRAVQESSSRALRERLVAAQLTARHTDNFLRQYIDVLTQIVDGEAGELRSADPVARARLLERLQHGWGNVLVHGVFLTDEAGGLLWSVSSDGDAPGEASAHHYDIAPEVLETGQGAVSNAYADESGRILISIGVPVRGAEGRVAGVLLEAIDLFDAPFNGFVQPVSLGSTGYAEIVDRNGLVLASSNRDTIFRKSDHTDQFAGLIDARRPTVGGCHSCHAAGGASQVEPDILAFAPLSAAPWGVAIRQSESEALGPTRDLERLLVIAGIGAIVVAALTVWLTSRSVVWPIRALTLAARRIAAGDLDSSVDRRAPAEIGELARAFDEMRIRLKASMDGLEQANSTLERRVEQRTRQLAALLDVSKALASTLDLRELLDVVAARAKDVLDLADAGIIALCAPTSGRQEVRASWGYEAAIRMMSFGPGEGATGIAMATGKPVLADTPEAIAEVRSRLDMENRAWLAQASHGLGSPGGLMSLPLVVKGKAIGAMTVEHYADSGTFTQADLRLAQALADQTAVAVEKARLYEEVLEKEVLRGELLEKVISAQEDERKRIARELHDDTCQSLAALAIRLEEVEQGLPERAVEARSELSLLKMQVSATLREVRTIAYNLRPSILDDLGLVMAIDWYGKEHVTRRGLEVHVDADGMTSALPPALETVLFRIAQESLNNVAKHSGASRATVRLMAEDGKVTLEVEDNGLGFDVERVLRPRGHHRTLGLQGMIERARLSGGILKAASSIGRGTLIRVELPVQAGQENGCEKDHGVASR